MSNMKKKKADLKPTYKWDANDKKFKINKEQDSEPSLSKKTVVLIWVFSTIGLLGIGFVIGWALSLLN